MQGITHAAINKTAKKNGWIRNLTDRVRERVEADLVSTEVSSVVSTAHPRELDIISQAAARGAVEEGGVWTLTKPEHLAWLEKKKT